MGKRKRIQKPAPKPPKIDPEVNPMDLDEPIVPEEDPDVLPDDDLFETPEEDAPIPGERP